MADELEADVWMARREERFVAAIEREEGIDGLGVDM